MSTVGLNDQMVAKYIREQEKHDIAMDKLGIKEYKDPFKKQLYSYQKHIIENELSKNLKKDSKKKRR